MIPHAANNKTNVLCTFCTIFQNNKQGIHRHQTAPRCRNATSGSRLAVHASPYGPLRPNVTSSIKPEIHNVLQRHQKRTEPRSEGICTQNFVKIGPAVPEICSRTDICRALSTDLRDRPIAQRHRPIAQRYRSIALRDRPKALRDRSMAPRYHPC